MSAPLLTVPDACCALGGISRAQLYRLIQAGDIETAHIGRLMRIPSQSLDAYIDRLIEADRVRHGGPSEAA